MTTPINDGGPAFPQVPVVTESHGVVPFSSYSSGVDGMSLRKYYIGQIIAGLAAGPYWSANVQALESREESRRLFVKAAIATVDTLMEELDK